MATARARDYCLTGSRDGCCVSSATLAAIVGSYVAKHETSFGEPATHVLARRSGLSEATIRRALRPRQPTVDLRTADALLTAIDRPDVLASVPVYVNPQASKAARAECCGGSLPKSLSGSARSVEPSADHSGRRRSA